MADNQLYTQESALTKAAEIQTALALSKLRLVQGSVVITQFTTRETLLANEADFDGYPTGGYTLTAWSDPLKAAVGGAVITSPLINIAYGPASDPPVTNSVCGWWIDDADGNVRTAGNYNPPRLLQALGDGFQFVDQLIEARNAPAPEA